jgi:signal transduction histidine kinase/CheY-like chemotaxis protein
VFDEVPSSSDMANLRDTTPSVPKAALVASCLAAATGLTVLLGWALRLERLTAFIPGLPVMNPMTALCLVAASASLILLLPIDAGKRRKALGKFLAAVVLAIGAVKILSLVSGWDVPIDRLLFADRLNSARIPSRIAVRSAIEFLLLGGALLLLETRTRRGFRPAEILCAASAVIAFLALFGYSYGLITLYRTQTYEPMSLPGAIAFIALAAGTLLARTGAGAMRVIVSDTAGGLLARLLLPLGFLLPVLFGALRLAGETSNWYSSRVGIALFATAFTLVFLLAVGLTTRVLFRADTERNAAEERVRQLNAELEQRVADRTAELNLLNQELRQASNAKDDFLAVLSHELRTPLTPALAAAGYLAEHGDLPEELREEVVGIRANVQLEARLIDDLLDLTRITRGKIELHLEAVDAHDLLRKTLEIVHEDVRQKQLDLVSDLAAPDHHVRADRVRLQQVFWNLLSNAVKFTARGGRITVRSRNDGGHFTLEVTDTGVGIEPELQSRIFKAFEQGERSIARQFGGLGLGLTISKTLLDLQGGTISVRSEGKNHGASFDVTFQVVAAPELKSREGSARAGTIPEGLDLLLVDDHAQTLHVLSRLLRKRGHKVSTADSVKSALHLLDRARFDALISDIGLPDGNGCDVMRAAKQRQELRGIAVSGFGMDDDIRRSKEAGFEHHLTKPVDLNDLETCLGQITSHLRPGVD